MQVTDSALRAIAAITCANLLYTEYPSSAEIHYDGDMWLVIDKDNPANKLQFTTAALSTLGPDVFNSATHFPDWQRIWRKFIRREVFTNNLSVSELIWFSGLSDNVAVVETDDGVAINDGKEISKFENYAYLNVIMCASVTQPNRATAKLKEWKNTVLPMQLRTTCSWLWALTNGQICEIQGYDFIVKIPTGPKNLLIHVPCDFMLTLDNFSVPYCGDQLKLLESMMRD